MEQGLIVGAGPSLDLEFVKNFNGLKLVCDVVLKKCLNYGIKPDLVFTLEDISIFWKLFSDVEPLKVVCSERCHQNTLDYLKKHKFEIIKFRWEYERLVTNVGLMTFCYAWKELKLDNISLIGLDSCVYEAVINPYDDILISIINPNNVKCYLDPLHQIWREQFLDFLELAPRLKVFNYSNGCLFGDKITWCRLKELEIN